MDDQDEALIHRRSRRQRRSPSAGDRDYTQRCNDRYSVEQLGDTAAASVNHARSAHPVVPPNPIAPPDGPQLADPSVNFGGEHFQQEFKKADGDEVITRRDQSGKGKYLPISVLDEARAWIGSAGGGVRWFAECCRLKARAPILRLSPVAESDCQPCSDTQRRWHRSLLSLGRNPRPKRVQLARATYAHSAPAIRPRFWWFPC